MTMGFRGTLELLKEAGGRASVRQLRKMARERDPLSPSPSINGHLLKLRAWREVDYDRKKDEWFVCP